MPTPSSQKKRPIPRLKTNSSAIGLSLALNALWATNPCWAESVYRCGDSYSPSTHCELAPARPIETHGPHASPSLPTQIEQRSADAAEKKPIAPYISRSQPIQMPIQRHLPLPAHTAQDRPQELNLPKPKHKSHAKATSPYFTAKDLNAPAKAKKNEKKPAALQVLE